MDFLQMTFQAYLEWRMAPVGIYMSIAPAIIAAIIATAGPLILDKLAGGPSSQERQQQSNANAVSSAEAERIRKQLEFLERLQELSKQPSAMQAILEATGGKGFTLPRNLADARAGSDSLGNVLGAIDFSASNERDLLQSLVGIPTSSPLTFQGSAQAFDQQQGREQGIGDIAALISTLINSRSRSTAPSSVVVPPSFATGTTSSGTPLGFGIGG